MVDIKELSPDKSDNNSNLSSSNYSKREIISLLDETERQTDEKKGSKILLF